ncbi:hypothetical protein ILUMI_06362 [Ignelater luminosus]|uniref:Alpha-1,6-mannosyl-glycoprotein 2-beta-N-acetylglucosaminyltransferase n=1 Tax=Ignelater luminosus TaxID=2038154 RepID=A0A8K0DAF9_IGNLU|nr:hypothetical protein ILUMI_06362 [Ignelater luminosus]
MGQHRFKGDKVTKRQILRIIFVLFGILVILGAASLVLFITVFDATELDILEGEDTFYHSPSGDSPAVTNEIEEKVSIINSEETIRNEEIFGKLNNYSTVIVIQVHKHVTHLQNLLKSFQDADDIKDVLLIFSHDFFDEELNRLIKSIKFCRVMQIFYPHSIQIYPNVFPGMDPDDCTPNMNEQEALQKKCRNHYIDRTGKYRHPQLSQVKHHWWWKANRVFDLAKLETYDGWVLFLEEDNYVLKDFLYVLKLMKTAIKYSCRNCKVLALSSNSNNEKSSHHMGNYKVAITNRLSNLGMAFNRELWIEITKCKYSFCFYDDHNFDLSLRNVFRTCIPNAQHLVLYASRVFRLGSCVSRYRIGKCGENVNLAKVSKLVHDSTDYLFPERLHLISKQYNLSSRSYGRWGDPRDHALCLGMTIK